MPEPDPTSPDVSSAITDSPPPVAEPAPVEAEQVAPAAVEAEQVAPAAVEAVQVAPAAVEAVQVAPAAVEAVQAPPELTPAAVEAVQAAPAPVDAGRAQAGEGDGDGDSDGDTRRPRKRRRSRRRRGGSTGGPAAPEAVLAPVAFDRSLPPDAPLTKTELREMKRHLRFLAQYRRAFRLRFNAAEDLLINGAREPDHRGTCLHLLGKVDHDAVQAALSRVSTPPERTRLLEGAVRMCDDARILLLYVESLSDSASKRKAAGAFSLAVGRIDWSEASPAQVERVLALATTVFEGHERTQVIFGLLHSASFRDVCDDTEDRLPADVKRVYRPLRAAHASFIELQPDVRRADLLKGAALLLEAPDEALKAYPTQAAVRLARAAMQLTGEVDDADRAAGALVASLPPKSKAYRELTLERAGVLLRAGQDTRARWHLDQLRNAQRDCVEAEQLVAALKAPRIGRMALLDGAGATDKGGGRRSGKGPRGGAPPRAPAPPPGTWRSAFWIDEQRDAWLRVGAKGDAAAYAAAAKLHARLPVRGVAPLLASGVEKDGRPWYAVASLGKPAAAGFDPSALSPRAVLTLALQGAQLLLALAEAGVAVPDARRGRFLVGGNRAEPDLLLADFAGATVAEPEEARKRHERVAVGLTRELTRPMADSLPPGLAGALARRRVRLSELVRVLAMEVASSS